MNREYYSDSIEKFRITNSNEIIGIMASKNKFTLEQTQCDAWIEQISLLQRVLSKHEGSIYFEYSIPRMGRRIDVVLLIESVIFVLEFKIGESVITRSALDQVWDYTLDLKNFHETSHNHFIAPILIATKSADIFTTISFTPQHDKVFLPISCNAKLLCDVINGVLSIAEGNAIEPKLWAEGRYHPTPTIVEAAMALYAKHSVEDISRSDASAINLKQTSEAISNIIQTSKNKSQKSICFITGVPGAGKTLVGLNIATKHIDQKSDLYSVFLSGNGPLVAILREALARDKVRREKEEGNKITKSSIMGDIKTFIQNVHHFRDECLIDFNNPPREHVALFDEAQRAWNIEQTASFMHRKKNIQNFNQSEPEFLISCLDRHKDWAVIVCLVGGGQEINTGEAGISEWINSLNRSFSHWHIYISSQLHESEYGSGMALENIKHRSNVSIDNNLHLSVSMRSFRAEDVSLFVKQTLDLQIDDAQKTYVSIKEKYPLVLTRNLGIAKQWLKDHARGTERYGIIVSSQAERLKPHAIDVKTPMNPIHWFLNGKDDVRSSFYLEDVATEFHVQGLELDWACVTWDADLRYTKNGWMYKSFRGKEWVSIHKEDRKKYLKNAYRVLLTRARQGMVIAVPYGEPKDPTRKPEFYDSTFEYLKDIGIPLI